MSQKPQVMIVGRVNVGKSTLFNRLSRGVKSITLDYEGVTRDYLKEEIDWQGARFELIDSGGIHLRKSQDELFESVRKQVLSLIEQTDVILFMVDGTVGILQEDREIATYIHKLKKPVILVINKIDSKAAQEKETEFERLGFSRTVPVSAEHGKGISDLLDAVLEVLPSKTGVKPTQKPLYRVMLLGKPNVGKSSLMNELLKEERALVSEIPGTTREALSEQITFYKEEIGITDTPGIRRQKAVTGELESLMVRSAFEAMRRSHIVLLLIDGASDTLVDQELKLAFYVFKEQSKALIILINKQDLMTDLSIVGLEKSFDYYKHLIDKVPVLRISCKTGKNVGKILPLVTKIWQRSTLKVDDIVLQKLFIDALMKKPLYHKRMLLYVYKVRQIRVAPITIEMRVNEPEWFGPSQLTFFENILRSEYDMIGVPVKFVIYKRRKGSSNAEKNSV